MKKSFNILKIAVALLLVTVTALSFASCGFGGANAANDAEGKIENTEISWKYTKEGQKLVISGSGAIPNFKSAAEVPWHDVATSVKTVKVGEKITAIGDYSFYYMTQLTDVTVPEGVKTVGKSAFAFCSALETVKLPSTVTTIGSNCFEASGLTYINLPETVKNVGDKAFAHCAKLTNVVIRGAKEIKADTFIYCTGLKTLVLPEALKLGSVKISGDKTFKTTALKADTPDAIAPPVEEEETEAPTEAVTDEKDEETKPVAPKEDTFGTGTIIAIVALVVVVIGVVVGVVLFIRYDKKNSGNTTTVKKNKDSKKKKK